jgi:hypothetical protein
MEYKGTMTSKDTWIKKQKEVKICGRKKNKRKIQHRRKWRGWIYVKK